MKLRKKLRRGTVFLLVLLLIVTLVGNYTEAVFAEEAKKMQEVVETTPLKEEGDDETGQVQGAISETETGVQNDVESEEKQEKVKLSVPQWSWSADGESLQWSEQNLCWELNLPNVNEKNPMTPEILLKDYLPKTIKANVITDTTEEKELVLSWNLADFPKEAWKGEYKITASLNREFVLAEGARPLEVTVLLGGADTIASGNLDKYTVDGMTPRGTKIDLFDYWSTERWNNDRISNSNDGGINKGHDFKFTHGSGGFGDMNNWTGSAEPRKNIVKNKLGENGYPEFSGTLGQKVESLDYLFDPSVQHGGKKSFDNVGGLLQVDKEGYYYYNCQENYAVLDEQTKQFKLYNKPGVYTGDEWTEEWTTNNVNNGQFFPFNVAESVFKEDGVFLKRLEQERVNSKSTVDNNPKDLQLDTDKNGNIIFCDNPFNHYFGVSMSTQFIQKDGGYTDNTANKKRVTYEFSGDDDVWVFIDNVLVADLGGIHSRAALKIDFATGEIYINNKYDGTLRDKFKAAGVKGHFDGNTFADNTYHTLDFFYLERGNADSNIRLKFNLVTVPESEIVKVDQIGEAVPGAEFALYHTGKDYAVDSQTNPIATGITDKDGQFILLDNEGRIVSLQRLSEQYKGEAYFVLRETKVPEGYRPAGSGDVKLYIPENAKYPVLLADDSWYTGSRALAKLMTTASNEITLAPNEEAGIGPNGNKNVDLNKKVGKMFAVILQYDHSKDNGNITDPNSWRAVSGDPIKGWNVQKGTNMENILIAARNNPYIFEVDASGAYKAEVEELPGDILNYYFMQSNPTPENTDYTVAYYYTTENSLEEANVSNTWRVDKADFERMFAARLYVPNIENHVYVKKVDEKGNAVNGAKFGLYRETNAGVHKNPNGTVTIDETANPDYEQTTDTLAGYPFKEDIDGALVFPRDRGLPMGTYYLKELSVPDGYELNSKVTKIVIDKSGVYADAGDVNDGIRVGRSIGMIVKSMVQFAAGDDVDNTLHDLITRLKVSNNYIGADTKWTYADPMQENYLRFQPDDTSTMLEYAALEGSKSLVEIDEGWSQFEVRQNYKDNQHGVTSDLKMDWREYELRNLFSGLVFVTVTNERVGDLEISKQVQSDLDIDADKEFMFKITLEGAVKPNEVYKAQITDMSGNPIGAEFEFGNNEEVKLKHHQKLTIYKLPYNTKYTVTEKNALGYTPSVTINGVHTDGTVLEEGYTVSGQIAWTDNTDIIEQVAYTNTYTHTGEFDFTKTDKGGNALAGAKFAMYRLDCKEENNHHAEELLKVDDSGELTDETQKKCWTLEARAESQTDGKVSFENLAVAEEYRLVEYKAAPGYVTPKGQWRVVYAGSKFVFPSPDGIGGMDSGIGNPPAVEMNGDTYSIANYKPTELPFSGNRGIKAFLILGILFMTVGGLGGLLWQFKKNKKI